MAAVTFQIFDLLNTSMPFDGDGGVHCILLAEMTAQIFFILLNPHLPLKDHKCYSMFDLNSRPD